MHEDDFNKGMRGEFRGDFTRDTFDPFRHFSRVLMQQGRVQLDSDWNEQVSILTHYFRMLGADLMGPHVAPLTVDGDEGQGRLRYGGRLAPKVHRLGQHPAGGELHHHL